MGQTGNTIDNLVRKSVLVATCSVLCKVCGFGELGLWPPLDASDGVGVNNMCTCVCLCKGSGQLKGLLSFCTRSIIAVFTYVQAAQSWFSTVCSLHTE